MSYTALYRKFRPLTFSEMVGQEHITQTLKNQVIANRVGHAYLFNGGRGTGKTSAAKILARAMNCLNPKDGEPCNECEICKAMLSGSLTDVVEMDAASNNSVEDIRSIREEVNFLPTVAKYRVYIIDEVHMLSTGAFNALLKTLEEPPEHVKFILATTEPQKLPATILSRCQRFDFKTISDENIIKRLKIVCEESKIQITKEALNIIATLSEGAMRDALSILERCLQDGDTNINEDKVKDLVGIPKLVYVSQIVEAIVNYNVDIVIKTVNSVIEGGKDVNNLLWEIIKYTNDILLYQTTGETKLYSKDEVEQMKKIASAISKERLLNTIYQLSELENSLKWSSQKRMMFQVGLIKLCTNINTDGLEELKKRIDQLEQKLQGEIKIMNNKTEEPSQIKQVKAKATKPAEKQTIGVKNGKTSECWKTIVGQLKNTGKIMLYTNLINTEATEINDMTIGIEFPNGITSFGKTVLEKPENRQELERLISMECGKQMRIKYIDKKQEPNNQNNASNFEDLVKDLNIPIHIIED